MSASTPREAAPPEGDSAPAVDLGLVVSGLPHPLLVPEQNPGWARIRDAYGEARQRLEASGAEVLVLYSTMWPSVLGHQVQAHPAPEFVHVDELFHDLGSIPYRLEVDTELAAGIVAAGGHRGLHMRSVAYQGFPVDTGSVVACKLLNPDNRLPVVILSSNVYADRAETVVLGKACRDALAARGRRAAVAVVSSLSNRLLTDFVAPEDDRIHSLKDDEWNRKLLEFLADGRLEDVAQLSREVHRQVRVQKVVSFKPFWFLSAVMGAHNRYRGEVHGYAPIHGTGAAVVSLRPTEEGVGLKEFDEEDVEAWGGDREVVAGKPGAEGWRATVEATPVPVGPPPSDVAPGRPGAGVYPTSPLGEAVEGIPTGRDVEWQPLVDQRRHDVSETTVHGAVAWAHGDQLVHSFGGNVLCYGRSMMKPVMMKVFADELAEVLTPEQKAIAISSHNGDTEHVAAAMSILSPSERGLMQTPLDVPLVQFGRQVRRPRRWYHCCSGEHAAILRGLHQKGWSRVGYTLPQHPMFPAYLEVLRDLLGEPGWQPARVARDGCGLPTVSNTVGELARIFAALVARRRDDWIFDAATAFPDLVGGFDRLDSTCIKAGAGRILAKEGADGLLGLAIDHPDFPRGLGVVVKIAHGWNPSATWTVARAVLGVLGIELRNPAPLRRQKAFVVPGVVPEDRQGRLAAIPTWDEWDPDTDRWTYDWRRWAASDQQPVA